MARPEKVRLGDLLVQQKLISQEQLKFCLLYTSDAADE